MEYVACIDDPQTQCKGTLARASKDLKEVARRLAGSKKEEWNCGETVQFWLSVIETNTHTKPAGKFRANPGSKFPV